MFLNKGSLQGLTGAHLCFNSECKYKAKKSPVLNGALIKFAVIMPLVAI